MAGASTCAAASSAPSTSGRSRTLDLADPDVDGDTLLDGEDDQDNDDINNISEIYEVNKDLDGDGGFTCGPLHLPEFDLDRGPAVDPRAVNAFNPCAPDPNSRTCHDWQALQLAPPEVPPPTWRPHPRK